MMFVCLWPWTQKGQVILLILLLGNMLNLTWSSGHRGYIDIDWLKKYYTGFDAAANYTLPVAVSSSIRYMYHALIATTVKPVYSNHL